MVIEFIDCGLNGRKITEQEFLGTKVLNESHRIIHGLYEITPPPY
jgi:hypothetical protein